MRRKWLPYVWRIASKTEDILAVLVFSALICSVLFSVLMRYVFGQPVMWSDAGARLLFTWCLFLGSSVAMKYRFHISVDYFIDRLPRKAYSVARFLVSSIVLAVLLFLVVFGFIYTGITWKQRVAPFDFSYGYFALAIPVSATLMILHVLFGRREPGAVDPTSLGRAEM